VDATIVIRVKFAQSEVSMRCPTSICEGRDVSEQFGTAVNGAIPVSIKG
jgi:hypothetical protein